jgi:hypothetical protein
MSHERLAEVECPQCGAARSVTIWDSLNADISPEARQELFQGKINTFECASCEAMILLPVPLLYHDMQRRFVVQYFPAGALDDDGFFKRFTPDGTDRSTADILDKIPQAVRAMHRLDYMQRERVFDQEQGVEQA